MWEAIDYVNGPFTLVAFIAALALLAYRFSVSRTITLIKSASESDRTSLIEDVLEGYHVDLSKLTRDQVFIFALEKLRQREARFRWGAILLGLFGVLGFVLLFTEGRNSAHTQLKKTVVDTANKYSDNSKSYASFGIGEAGLGNARFANWAVIHNGVFVNTGNHNPDITIEDLRELISEYEILLHTANLKCDRETISRIQEVLDHSKTLISQEQPDWDKATAKLSDIIVRQDQCPTAKLIAHARIMRATAWLISGGREQRAIRDLDTVLEMEGIPPNLLAEARLTRGWVYEQSSPPRIDEAIADYSAVLKLEGLSQDLLADARSTRGLAYALSSPPRIDKAIADLSVVLEMKSVSQDLLAEASLHRGLAFALSSPPRIKEAIADLSVVVEMEGVPQDLLENAQLNRGSIYALSSPPLFEEAVADFSAVLGMEGVPKFLLAIARSNRGWVYAHSSPPLFEEAITDFSAILEMEGLQQDLLAMAQSNRGWVYANASPPRIEEAIADCSAVLTMEDVPQDLQAMARSHRGWVYAHSSPPHIEEAIAEYSTVLEMEGVSQNLLARAFLNRGGIYARSSPPRIEEAIADCSAVLAMEDVPQDLQAMAENALDLLRNLSDRP